MKRHVLVEASFVIVAMMVFIAIIGISGYLAQQTATTHTDEPDVISVVVDEGLQPFAQMWEVETARRFHHSVVILAHGGEFVSDEWISEGSPLPGHIVRVQELVRSIQARYTDRTIVVLACNPGHLKLGIPGVYYASSSVWCVPDRALTPTMMQNKQDRLTFDGPLVWSSMRDDAPAPTPSRWEMSPADVGNIWEFQHD